MDQGKDKTGSPLFSIQVMATAKFGNVRWLPFMLTSLNDELTQIFFHQDLKQIEAGAQPKPLRDRARYATAIGALFKLFARLKFNRIVVENFLELSLALFELDHGIVRDFLKPNKAGSRPPDPGDIWVIRAYIAIALDIVACDPDPRAHVSEAAKHIAKGLGILAHVLTPDSPGQHRDGKVRPESDRFADAMIAWRKKFLRKEAPDERAQSIFDNRERLAVEVAQDMIARGEQISSIAVSAKLLNDVVLQATLAADRQALAKMLPALRRAGRKQRTGK